MAKPKKSFADFLTEKVSEGSKLQKYKSVWSDISDKVKGSKERVFNLEKFKANDDAQRLFYRNFGGSIKSAARRYELTEADKKTYYSILPLAEKIHTAEVERTGDAPRLDKTDNPNIFGLSKSFKVAGDNVPFLGMHAAEKGTLKEFEKTGKKAKLYTVIFDANAVGIPKDKGLQGDTRTFKTYDEMRRFIRSNTDSRNSMRFEFQNEALTNDVYLTATIF